MSIGILQRSLCSLAVGLTGWASIEESLAALPQVPSSQAATLYSVAATASRVRNYNLGTLSLRQPDLPAPFTQMPVPLQGIMAVPDGVGPFPVVVILHGRHSGCHFTQPWSASIWPCPAGLETRFDQGFDYLAEKLARQGYLTLAVDLNGAYTFSYGATATNYNSLPNQRSLQIIDAHLTRLAAANRGDAVGFGMDLTGKVDLSRLVLIGHSMGGSAAAVSGLMRQRHTSAEQVTAGLGPVSALLLVAPTPSGAIDAAPLAYTLPDVPVSVLLGGCDRDIFDFSSLYYYEAAAQTPRQHTVASVLIPGANHHFFNRALVEDDYSRQLDNAPVCAAQSPLRLSRQAQEDFLVSYIQDFLATVFAEGNAPIGWAATQTAPDRLYQVPVLTNLSLAAQNQRSLLNLKPSAPFPASLHVVGTLSLQQCPALQACDRYFRPRPQFPTVLRLSWQDRSGRLQVNLPNAAQDMREFDSIQIRLALDSTDVLNEGQRQAVAIVLHDRQGRAARVEIPALTPALRQFAPDPKWGYRSIPVYPSAVRIPLAQFQGVDLGAIATVELLFDQSERGVLYLADIAVLKSELKNSKNFRRKI
ncbi:MAG TPA: hypothetical protein V6D29_14840 [Leptolyngbyaceae cyanobacterium]